MLPHDYRFLTRWRVKGPLGEVYRILKDGEMYSRWWCPAYQETRKVGPRSVAVRVRAKLPYSLSFTTELVREKEPTELEIRATGELVGRGLWTLRAEGEETLVDFLWEVRAEKPWVKFLTPFLKPLFQWNHDWVMRVGEKGLQSEITRSHWRSQMLTRSSQVLDGLFALHPSSSATCSSASSPE